MPSVRNCQLIAEAPLEITVKRTKPSGTSMTTNATHMPTVAIWFLVRRQPLGSRRSTVCCSLAMAIMPPVRGVRSGPRSRGRSG